MLRTTNTTSIWKRVLIMSVMVLLGAATAALELTTESFGAEQPRVTFASPAEAGAALAKAAKTGDENSLTDILGVDVKTLLFTGNDEEDEAAQQVFAAKYEMTNRWVDMSDGSRALYIGADNWPFPIPLKKDAAGQWYFDTKAGLQEILFRRIGKNEFAAIHVCQALVQAQQEYFEQAHDGDTVHQYAQQVISDSGKENGLYWKTGEGQPESPIGPLVAFATAKGYGGHDTPQPFYGYYYRLLTAQGPTGPGGAKSYLVDGKMTGGFAFVAYPAEYRNSGVMTFLVDQSGIVYQKDLGPNTAEIANQIKAYSPDKTWVTAETGDEADDGN